MKNSLTSLSLILLICSLFFLSSCKKEETPDYPMLIGYWTGHTSQENTIEFKVENKKGTLYITKYRLVVTYSNGSIQTFESINSRGIVALTGLSFNIPLASGNSGAAYISGNFNLSSQEYRLTGNFAAYYPSSSVDLVTGNYIAYLY